MIFEDVTVPVPAAYDKILTQFYGNYMQLPPENQRIRHDFDAYYIDRIEAWSKREKNMNSFSHFEIHTDDAVLEQFERLRGLNREGTKQWERQIESDVNMLFKKWGI